MLKTLKRRTFLGGVGLSLAGVWSSLGVALAQSTLTVSGPSELEAALQQAGRGSILQLAGGDYGIVDLQRIGGTVDQPIIIRSADRADRARFSRFKLDSAQNIVLADLVFDYAFAPGHPRHIRPFRIINSTGIVVRNCLFDGDVAQGVSPLTDGFGTGQGLNIGKCTGVTVEGCEIRTFMRGIVMGDCYDVVITGNNLHSLRSDGMDFVHVERILIEDNYIHDFNKALGSGDHSDMIQFWTNRSEAPTRDVVIRNNVLNSGHGWFTQSIFMRNDLVDRGLAGPEMFYRNITIEGNVIINAHLHGITVGETDGLFIRNNTVVRNARSEGNTDNPALWTPRINVSGAARNVEILRNVTNRIVGYDGQPDWIVADNLMVQDVGRLTEGLFYDRVFVNAIAGDPSDLASFASLPGGPLDGTGIGAPRLAQ
jgi:hypothetical protein